MLVVVSMPDGPTGERFESVLLARGHRVLRFERMTKRGVLDSRADVFVCGDRRSIRLVSALLPTAHIVAALPDLEDRRVSQALEAGALDLVGIQARPEELIARVTLPERLADRRRRASGEIAPAAWDEARSTIDAHLEVVFGRPVIERDSGDEHPCVCARISLTSSESTLDLIVGCSKTAARSLLRLVAPGLPGSREVLRDSLRELANNLAGALKRATTSEEVTLGLPSDCDQGVYTRAAVTWEVAVGEVVIALGLTPGRAARRSIPVAELRPGMVLQHDVLNPAGMPFVRTGTALSERTIERLAEVLGDSTCVAVTVEAPEQSRDVEAEPAGVVFLDVG